MSLSHNVPPMRFPITLVMVCVLLAISAGGPTAAQTQSEILAPTGTLRAVFLARNPVQGRMDEQTGEYVGVVPDIIRELARTLGVPSVILPAVNARQTMDMLNSGEGDIGFLAFNESRAREVDYGAAFLLMLSSYLVPADSTLTASTDVDQPGVTVGASRASSQEIFVSSQLNDVQVRIFDFVPPQAELEQILTGGEVDAFALNRQVALDAEAAAGSSLRTLPDSFLNVEQAFVVPKGHTAKLGVIEAFVAELHASGFIKSSIERAGLGGVDVVPEGNR